MPSSPPSLTASKSPSLKPSEWPSYRSSAQPSGVSPYGSTVFPSANSPNPTTQQASYEPTAYPTYLPTLDSERRETQTPSHPDADDDQSFFLWNALNAIDNIKRNMLRRLLRRVFRQDLNVPP
jgi:hypothetical protein